MGFFTLSLIVFTLATIRVKSPPLTDKNSTVKWLQDSRICVLVLWFTSSSVLTIIPGVKERNHNLLIKAGVEEHFLFNSI